MGRARTDVARGISICFAVSIAVALVLWAALPGLAQEQGFEEVTSQASADGFLGTNGARAPKLDWDRCGRGPGRYQCATAEVPLSYRKPNGKTVELALGKLPAKARKNKVGTLFWNPGGPGGPGRFPPSFSPALRRSFDIVGFDPRGVGESDPVRCFGSFRKAIRAFGKPFPITEAQEQRVVEASRRGTTSCERNGGPLFSHVSTANVARDMEMLRRAVGARKLNYIGFSYGTHLGEVYANLFPGRVRAMTLDAVLDPVEWTTGEPGGGPAGDPGEPFSYRLGSFDGAQQSLESFLDACAEAEDCAFAEDGADGSALLAKYETLLDRLREEPAEITLPGGEETFRVTYQDAVGITTSFLYDAAASPFLAELLEDLYRATEPAARRADKPPTVDLPDVSTRPTLAPASAPADDLARRRYTGGLEWFNAVSCADTTNPDDPGVWYDFAAQADEDARGFGSLWTYASLPCATWPFVDRDRYVGPWTRKTAKTVLLIGNSQGDPATPYEDAVATEELLSNARLLTLDSFGHTAAYGGQSRCVNRTVDRYLIQGELPPEGKVCQPDFGPFAEPSGSLRNVPKGPSFGQDN